MAIKHPAQELPIRSKLDMLDDIVQIISYLHRGDRKASEGCMKDLKTRALFLEEGIQRGVLMFLDQVEFQYNYDPFHKVTYEVRQAADFLIEQLGFRSP